MSQCTVTNVGVDSKTWDHDATASCSWNSGSEKDISGMKPL